MRAAAILLALTTPLAAQLPEDTGPHLVGWRDVAFDHPVAANSPVLARVYYPALEFGPETAPDTGSGPYPLVGFCHGYFAFAGFYDDLWGHVASWGFVVISLNTETGLVMIVPNAAADAHAMLQWADAGGADPSSFLYEMIDPGPWVYSGHSTGGAALFEWVNDEPRVGAVALLEPSWLAPPAAEGFDNNVLIIGATHDVVAPFLLNATLYDENLTNAPRRTFAVIQGGGHNGSLDFPSALNPLSHAEQHRMHRKLVGAFLRAERKGEEDLYAHLVGDGVVGQPVDPKTTCSDPPLWAVTSLAAPGNVSVGLAGTPGDVAIVAVAGSPGFLPTPWGIIGLDLSTGFVLLAEALGPLGSTEINVPLGAAPSGTTVLVQGVALGPTVGAVTSISIYVVP